MARNGDKYKIEDLKEQIALAQQNLTLLILQEKKQKKQKKIIIAMAVAVAIIITGGYYAYIKSLYGV